MQTQKITPGPVVFPVGSIISRQVLNFGQKRCSYGNLIKILEIALLLQFSMRNIQIDRVLNGETISRTFPITCLGADVGDCLNGGNLTVKQLLINHFILIF